MAPSPAGLGRRVSSETGYHGMNERLFQCSRYLGMRKCLGRDEGQSSGLVMKTQETPKIGWIRTHHICDRWCDLIVTQYRMAGRGQIMGRQGHGSPATRPPGSFMIWRACRHYDDVAWTYIDSCTLCICLFGIGEKHDSGLLDALSDIGHARELLIPALHPEPIEIDLCQCDTKSAFGGNQDITVTVLHGSLIGEGIGQLESDASRHPGSPPRVVALIVFARA
jgi:hypothetical protein